MGIMTETPLPVEGTRAYAQGEIFLLTKAGDRLDALVYNTTGLGPALLVNSPPSTSTRSRRRPDRTSRGRTCGGFG